MSAIRLQLVEGTPAQKRALQRVIDGAPGYSMRLSGRPPGPIEPPTLPPGWTEADRYLYGVYLGAEMIGCVDLLRGYPDENTAMLGLLLLAERYQHQGLGAEAYAQVEEIVRSWPEISVIRGSIIGSNDIVIPFWTRMGFVDTGSRTPYRDGTVESKHLIFEKKITRSG